MNLATPAAGAGTVHRGNAYYVDGMEAMGVDEYRAALEEKLRTYQGRPPAPEPGQKAVATADSYMAFLQAQEGGTGE